MTRAATAERGHPQAKQDPLAVESDSDDSAAQSAAIAQAMRKGRLANQFINVTYDDLLQWLHRWLRARQTRSWVHEWKSVFGNILPKHTYLRTQARFHSLLCEYEQVDPSFAAHRPLQGPVPDKQHMKQGSVDVDVQHNPQGVLPAKCERFMRGGVHELLVECGFSRMPQRYIKESQEDHTHGGLDVHIPGEDEVPVHVYFRNQYEKSGKTRRWQDCFRQSDTVDQYFYNIVLMYAYTYQKNDAPEGCCSKLKWTACNKAHRRAVGAADSEGKVFLRCYDNIPLYDLDMLMPGSSPNPQIFDALLVFVPLIAGLCTSIYKIVDIFHNVDDLTRVENLMIILFAIVAPFVVSAKAFVRGKNQLTKHRLHLAQMLNDHTVSTNHGTMMQLLSEAAEQEKKEALLAYTVLAEEEKAMPVAAVKARCNELLVAMGPELGAVDFDATDALADMSSIGLVAPAEGGGVQAKRLGEAREALSLSQFEHKG